MKLDPPDVEAPMPASGLASRPGGLRLPLLLVLGLFAVLAVASWGKFEHPTVDFGREVDIPARLVAGQVLYRDVQTFYGPLAYYLNAAVLALVGMRVEVFFAIGLALALAAVLLTYALTRRLTDERWGALAAACVAVYCAFSPGGLFGYVGPYSYGAVYATVLCLLAFAALDRHAATSATGWLLAAGAATGLAGLAKQEFGVAALVAVVAATVLDRRRSLGRRLLHAAAGAISAFCVLAPLGLLVASGASWRELQESLAPVGNLGMAGSSSLFRVSWGKSLWIWAQGLVVLGGALAVVAPALALTSWIGRRAGASWRRLGRGLELGLAIALSAAGMAGLRWIYLTFLSGLVSGSPYAFFHPLGKLSWTLPVIAVWALVRWRSLLGHRHSALLVSLIVFSLALNSRWLFHIGFYGLYAASAVIVFFVMLHQETSLHSFAGRLPVRRFLAICLLIGGAAHAIEYREYRHAIRSPRGTVYSNRPERAAALDLAIRRIEASRARSVFVLPEGALLNFLTGTYSPSRKTTFLPVDLPTAEMEREFLAELESDPPDLVVYLERTFFEWGYESLAEFNPLVDRWVTEGHDLVAVLPAEDEPIVRIFVRRDQASQGPGSGPGGGP